MPHTRTPALCQTEGGGLYVLGMSPAARQKRSAPNVIFLKFSTLFSLRRPHLFRLAGKDGGEKGRLGTFGAICI